MPERPPLAGVPIAIKDALSTRDIPTTAGSRILEGFRPVYTATCVDRLERAGAVVIGKTNMDEFAMGSSTENSAYQVTRNPWDPERVPGGSSGGSAAAVAAFQAPWALGSDTGGSIRQPAALCGIVGLKPTYGAVSRYGLIAFASSLDQVGPFARTVRDAALLFRHIAGHDPMDSTSLDWPEPVAIPEATDLRGLRFGVVDELMGDGVEPGVRAAVDAALAGSRSSAARCERVSLPSTEYGIATYYLLAPAECSANLARFDGIRYGPRFDGRRATCWSTTRSPAAAASGPRSSGAIMLGTFALASGYYDAYYLRAQKVRTLIMRDFEAAFARVDFVVSPTSPTVGLPPRRAGGGPVLHVPVRRLHDPGQPGRAPGDLDPVRPLRRAARGPADRRARRSARTGCCDAAHALEGAIGFEPRPPGVA